MRLVTSNASEDTVSEIEFYSNAHAFDFDCTRRANPILRRIRDKAGADTSLIEAFFERSFAIFDESSKVNRRIFLFVDAE